MTITLSCQESELQVELLNINIYVDSFERSGHHCDQHVQQDCNVCDVKRAEQKIAEESGQLVFKGLYGH